MDISKLNQLITNKRLRPLLVGFILVATILVFIRFFVVHPQYFDALKHIRPIVFIEIFVLNALLIIVLAFVYDFSLQLCGKHLPRKEILLLTAYSAIANFFGPLQSGPGVRSIYLKKKHQIRVRDFMLATLIGYAFFAMISVLFLIGGSRPWWQAIAALIIVGVVSVGVIKLFTRRGRRSRTDGKPEFILAMRPLVGLFFTTILEILIVGAYYFVELKAINPHTSLHQAISYTGAANFALFVSLTPDAIGFREAFLVLSQHLHHISTATILSANVLDRGVFAVFLIALFIVIVAVHAKDRLGIKQLRQAEH